MKTGIVG